MNGLKKILLVLTLSIALTLSGTAIALADSGGTPTLNTPSNLAVDDLTNELSWTEVVGAEYYSWSADDGTTWTNTRLAQANIYTIIVRAARAASETAETTSVNFKVRAHGADAAISTAGEYTYTFSKYNPFDGYSYFSAEGEVKEALIEGISQQNTLNVFKTVWKDVTFGMRRKNGNVYHDHFGIRIGYNNGIAITTSTNRRTIEHKTMEPSPTAAAECYLTIGTMDQLNLKGEKVAERIVAILDFDGTTQRFVKDLERWNDTTYKNAAGEVIGINEANRGDRMYFQGTHTFKAFGKDEKAVKYTKTGTALNVDPLESTAEVSYSIGASAWTSGKSIPLDTLNAAAENNTLGRIGYAQVDVKVVGETHTYFESYNYSADLGGRYSFTGTTDISDYDSSLKTVGANRADVNPVFAPPTDPDKQFGLNKWLQLKLRFPNLAAARKRIQFKFLAASESHNINSSTSGYHLSIFPNYYDTSRMMLKDNSNMGEWWAEEKFPEQIQDDILYDLKVGIAEVFDRETGDKIAEKFIAKLSYLDNNGEEKIIGSIEYDNVNFNSQSANSAKIHSYIDAESRIEIYSSTATQTFDISFSAGDQAIEPVQISWAQYYDITSKAPSADGFRFCNWYYTNDAGDNIEVKESGRWMHSLLDIADHGGQLTLKANFEAIDYDITYVYDGVYTNPNPLTYNRTQVVTFEALEGIADGWLFLGWYSDAAYTQPIEELNDQFGDKTIYAKMKEGFYITVDVEGDSTVTAVEKGESFTLPANPSTDDADRLEFVGWEVCDQGGETYTDYDGSTTFAVTEHKTFRAKFNYRTYTVSYELDGGTNHEDNPTSEYSAQTPITLRTPVRDGYFFDGWYTESTFTNRITVLTFGNQKLFAKFVPDEIPTSLNLYTRTTAQSLPPLDHPGESYTMTLYKADDLTAPLQLEQGNKYKFTAAGSYKLVYAVTYPDNTVVQKTLDVNITAPPVISINGEYIAKYTSGTVLTLLDGSIEGDVFDVHIKVKRDGEDVAVTDGKITLASGNYTLTYYAASTDVAEVVVSFTVADAEPKPAPVPPKKGCGKDTASAVGFLSVLFMSVLWIGMVIKRGRIL